MQARQGRRHHLAAVLLLSLAVLYGCSRNRVGWLIPVIEVEVIYKTRGAGQPAGAQPGAFAPDVPNQVPQQGPNQGPGNNDETVPGPTPPPEALYPNKEIWRGSMPKVEPTPSISPTSSPKVNVILQDGAPYLPAGRDS